MTKSNYSFGFNGKINKEFNKAVQKEYEKEGIFTCCLCGNEFEGMGNNPAPVCMQGRCCDDCNINKVVPARIVNPNFRSLHSLDPKDKILVRNDTSAEEIKEYIRRWTATADGWEKNSKLQDGFLDILEFLNEEYGLDMFFILEKLNKTELDFKIKLDILDMLEVILNKLELKDDTGEIKKKLILYYREKLKYTLEFLKFMGNDMHQISKILKEQYDTTDDVILSPEASPRSFFLQYGGEIANQDIERYISDFRAYFIVKRMGKERVEQILNGVKEATYSVMRKHFPQMMDMDGDNDAIRAVFLRRDVTYENFVSKLFGTFLIFGGKNKEDMKTDELIKEIYDELENSQIRNDLKKFLFNIKIVNNIQAPEISMNTLVDYINLTKTAEQMEKMKTVPISKRVEGMKDMVIAFPEAVHRGLMTPEEWLGDPKDHDIHYKIFNIPENDRMRNWQLAKRVLERMGNKSKLYNKDLFQEDGEIEAMKESILQGLIKPLIERSRPYQPDSDAQLDVIQDMEINKINYDNVFLPYPFMFVDCDLYLEDRRYFGFFLFDAFKLRDFKITTGKSISPQTMQIARYIVLPIFAKVTGEKDEPEPESKVFIEMFGLNDECYLPATGKDRKVQKQIRKFVCNFLIFFNQKEIVTVKVEPNPNNTKRRTERGLLPIPEYYIIRTSNKLKVYEDAHREWKANPDHHKKPRMFSFEVGEHNFYFKNKKHYKRIYSMSEEDLAKLGYKIDNEVNKGVIYRRIKGWVVGKGLPERKAIHRVVKE